MKRIIATTLAILAFTQISSSENFDFLHEDSISERVHTNKFDSRLADASPEIKQEDEDLAALNRLNNTNPAATNNFHTSLPLSAGIYTDTNRFLTATSDEVDASVERIKIIDLFREVQTILDGEGSVNDALDLLLTSLDTFKENESLFELNHRIGLLYHSLKNFEKAAEYIKKAFDENPGSVDIAINLGAIYLFIGEYDQAIETLSTVDPRLLLNNKILFNLHFNYTCAYSLKEEHEKAISHLELAARAELILTYTNLGDPMLDPIRELEGFKRIENILNERMKFIKQ